MPLISLLPQLLLSMLFTSENYHPNCVCLHKTKLPIQVVKKHTVLLLLLPLCFAHDAQRVG